VPTDAVRLPDHDGCDAGLRPVRRGSAAASLEPGAQHAFDFFYSIRFEAVIDGIEVFATRVLGR
jgi:hypothetical protein